MRSAGVGLFGACLPGLVPIGNKSGAEAVPAVLVATRARTRIWQQAVVRRNHEASGIDSDELRQEPRIGRTDKQIAINSGSRAPHSDVFILLSGGLSRCRFVTNGPRLRRWSYLPWSDWRRTSVRDSMQRQRRAGGVFGTLIAISGLWALIFGKGAWR
jgi:hypothetical protein